MSEHPERFQGALKVLKELNGTQGFPQDNLAVNAGLGAITLQTVVQGLLG